MADNTQFDLAADMRRRHGLPEATAISKRGPLAADMRSRHGIADEPATATAPKIDLVADMRRLHNLD